MSKDKILIVYPDKDIRKMFEIYFTGMGYDTICIGDRDALLMAITSENMPDAIVIKDGMPGSDGNALRTTLKDIASTRFIPIVFITYKSPADKMDELESVYDDFVTFPFDIEELELRVRNILKRSRQHG